MSTGSRLVCGLAGVPVHLFDMAAQKQRCGLVIDSALPYTNREMVRFRLFDIPISISPTMWLVLALLGGGMGLANASDLMPVAIFVIAGFLSLLVHELGHALVGRALGGGHPQIHMSYLGGVCHNPDGRWTRAGGIIMTAAGPLASLAVGFLAVVLLGAILHNFPLAFRFAWAVISPAAGISAPDALEIASSGLHMVLLDLIGDTVFVSFWWSVLNLLPVYPLDGGQIMGGLMNSARRLHMWSMVIAVLCLVLALMFNFLLPALFMIYFAIFNFKAMQASPI